MLLVLLASYAAVASDVEKEKRWADQIVDSLIDGEALWLQADGHPFLGIFTQAEDPESKAAAIIVHGIGAHPNWPQVVYPLRTALPQHGWSTLSLQMPILPNDAAPGAYAALIDEVPPRLDAGINFLKERGVETIVIIAHSLGATMSAYYLSTGDRDVQGFVAVGMAGGIQDSRILTAQMAQKITVPILDIYGSDDAAGVLAAASQRKALADKAIGGAYTSLRVRGANHFFDGKDDDLVDAVSAWLTTVLRLPGPTS
ncbi:DUF3530 family protein [Thiorhodococcus mannitoliphagus]|uniref:DUF3530 family protein n=1 Tax=Thiorhodococcus mannitoliphagus TaxID=329406 RepID=A0A6P1DYQ0_9GAMM|nr:DUF3530 family protein [Thiorhodococcus mannitoliphagus]